MQVSGFRMRQQNAAERIHRGDKLICYLTKLSRWMGVLEVLGDSFKDDTPIFYEKDDPYVVRFKVRPLAWLDVENAIPIREDEVWNSLSFTKGHSPTTSTWTGRLRASLTQMDSHDGQFLEKLILAQMEQKRLYRVDEQEYQKLLTHRIRTLDKEINVQVPKDRDVGTAVETPKEVRESIQMQALIASLGAKMGLKIWIPRNDRAAVMAEWHSDTKPVLDILPLNYDTATLNTIEQIDVLWLKGRSIVRAFEVEHTTSIYSGLLRMADLLALQPNMDIKLHIVAPVARRDKVFQELRRPVFSLLERGPLSESCTYISYDSLKELAQERHLDSMSSNVLDKYAEDDD
jgi:hypothetical protein